MKSNKKIVKITITSDFFYLIFKKIGIEVVSIEK